MKNVREEVKLISSLRIGFPGIVKEAILEISGILWFVSLL